MKIEVGKKYRRRDGVEVTIVRDDGDDRCCCFWGDDRACYGEDGHGSHGKLIEQIVDDPDEIVIEPGALVPPAHLAAAREMFRNGEEFFITAKSNGTEEGFCLASDVDHIWDDSSFHVRRGPSRSWLNNDPQGDVELHDGGEIVKPVTEQITIEPGEEFTTADVENVEAEFAEELCEDWSYTLTGTELRRELLRQVESCVCADRQNTYGDAEDNFARIAELWGWWLFHRGLIHSPDAITELDVAQMSSLIKVARKVCNLLYADNWVDDAGYNVCGGGLAKRKELNAKAIEADAAV